MNVLHFAKLETVGSPAFTRLFALRFALENGPDFAFNQTANRMQIEIN